MEIAQRGMPRSKIIDGNLDAQVRQSVKLKPALFKIAHDSGFRDLNVQPFGRETGFAQNLLYAFSKVLSSELNRGYVHGDGQGQESFLLPLFSLTAGLSQHPFANG